MGNNHFRIDFPDYTLSFFPSPSYKQGTITMNAPLPKMISAPSTDPKKGEPTQEQRERAIRLVDSWSWLKHPGKEDRKTAYVHINPEYAKIILDGLNMGNRPISDGTVSTYVKAMLAREWTESESMICFADDYTLLNGQQRLTAITVSRTTQEFFVKWGMPRSTFKTMDIGKKRTGGDRCFMAGIGKECRADISALSIQLHRYMHSQLGVGDCNPTADAHINTALRYESEFRASAKWRNKYLKSEFGIGNVSAALAHFCIMNGRLRNKGNDFIATLNSYLDHQIVLKEDSPIAALVRKLKSEKGTISQDQHDTRIEKGTHIINAFEKYNNGETMSKFTGKAWMSRDILGDFEVR